MKIKKYLGLIIGLIIVIVLGTMAWRNSVKLKKMNINNITTQKIINNLKK